MLCLDDIWNSWDVFLEAQENIVAVTYVGMPIRVNYIPGQTKRSEI
jgi:hypothetical protein